MLSLSFLLKKKEALFNKRKDMKTEEKLARIVEKGLNERNISGGFIDNIEISLF